MSDEHGVILRTTLIALLGAILLSSVLFIIIHFRESKAPVPENSANLTDCKMQFWTYCGMKVDENMCYKLPDYNGTQYTNCQLIDNKTNDCWTDGLNRCTAWAYNVSLEGYNGTSVSKSLTIAFFL
jgi:hypothetical protein